MFKYWLAYIHKMCFKLFCISYRVEWKVFEFIILTRFSLMFGLIFELNAFCYFPQYYWVLNSKEKCDRIGGNLQKIQLYEYSVTRYWQYNTQYSQQLMLHQCRSPAGSSVRNSGSVGRTKSYEDDEDVRYLFSSALAANNVPSKWTLLFLLDSLPLMHDAGGDVVVVDTFHPSGSCWHVSSWCLISVSNVTSIFSKRCCEFLELSKCLIYLQLRKYILFVSRSRM